MLLNVRSPDGKVVSVFNVISTFAFDVLQSSDPHSLHRLFKLKLKRMHGL